MGRTSFDDDGGLGSFSIGLGAEKAAMGDVDQQVVIAEEVRPQDGFSDIRQNKTMHNVEAREAERDLSRPERLDRRPVGSLKS